LPVILTFVLEIVVICARRRDGPRGAGSAIVALGAQQSAERSRHASIERASGINADVRICRIARGRHHHEDVWPINISSFAARRGSCFFRFKINPLWRIPMRACDSRPVISALAIAGLMLGVSTVKAQSPETVRVRGEIVSLDGGMLDVKSRQGSDVKIRLGDAPRIAGVVKASIDDIKPGVFIGVTSVPKEGSSSRALEIHLFPESRRGTGEGDRAWDLVPGSSMTNGTAASAVDSVDGKSITVNYKGGSRVIVISPDTSIVAFEPADASELKPGAKVFVIAQKSPDGALTAASINIGKNGIAPPM
jgi:hypothetical protein